MVTMVHKYFDIHFDDDGPGLKVAPQRPNSGGSRETAVYDTRICLWFVPAFFLLPAILISVRLYVTLADP